MALQILFGDDEHTAADGPYTRVMKTRKWLYVSSALVITIAGGWYDAASASKLIGGAVDLADLLLLPALTIGLGYLTLQYGMLLAQLIVSYEIVLRDRLAFRRQGELVEARDRSAAAHREVSDVFRRLAQEHEEKGAKLEAALQSAAMKLSVPQPPTDVESQVAAARSTDPSELVRESDGSIRPRLNLAVLQREHDRAEAELAAHRLTRVDFTTHPDFIAARATADEAEKQFAKIVRDDPASRRSYRWLERAVDGVRVFPPLFVAGYALWQAKQFLWSG